MAEIPLPGPTCSSSRCSLKSAASGQSQAVDEKDEEMSKALDWILEHLISARLLKDPCEVLHRPPCPHGTGQGLLTSAACCLLP